MNPTNMGDPYPVTYHSSGFPAPSHSRVTSYHSVSGFRSPPLEGLRDGFHSSQTHYRVHSGYPPSTAAWHRVGEDKTNTSATIPKSSCVLDSLPQSRIVSSRTISSVLHPLLARQVPIGNFNDHQFVQPSPIIDLPPQRLYVPTYNNEATVTQSLPHTYFTTKPNNGILHHHQQQQQQPPTMTVTTSSGHTNTTGGPSTTASDMSSHQHQMRPLSTNIGFVQQTSTVNEINTPTATQRRDGGEGKYESVRRVVSAVEAEGAQSQPVRELIQKFEKLHSIEEEGIVCQSRDGSVSTPLPSGTKRNVSALRTIPHGLNNGEQRTPRIVSGRNPAFTINFGATKGYVRHRCISLLFDMNATIDLEAEMEDGSEAFMFGMASRTPKSGPMYRIKIERVSAEERREEEELHGAAFDIHRHEANTLKMREANSTSSDSGFIDNVQSPVHSECHQSNERPHVHDAQGSQMESLAQRETDATQHVGDNTGGTVGKLVDPSSVDHFFPNKSVRSREVSDEGSHPSQQSHPSKESDDLSKASNVAVTASFVSHRAEELDESVDNQIDSARASSRSNKNTLSISERINENLQRILAEQMNEQHHETAGSNGGVSISKQEKDGGATTTVDNFSSYVHPIQVETAVLSGGHAEITEANEHVHCVPCSGTEKNLMPESSIETEREIDRLYVDSNHPGKSSHEEGGLAEGDLQEKLPSEKVIDGNYSEKSYHEESGLAEGDLQEKLPLEKVIDDNYSEKSYNEESGLAEGDLQEKSPSEKQEDVLVEGSSHDDTDVTEPGSIADDIESIHEAPHHDGESEDESKKEAAYLDYAPENTMKPSETYENGESVCGDPSMNEIVVQMRDATPDLEDENKVEAQIDAYVPLQNSKGIARQQEGFISETVISEVRQQLITLITNHQKAAETVAEMKTNDAGYLQLATEDSAYNPTVSNADEGILAEPAMQCVPDEVLPADGSIGSIKTTPRRSSELPGETMGYMSHVNEAESFLDEKPEVVDRRDSEILVNTREAADGGEMRTFAVEQVQEPYDAGVYVCNISADVAHEESITEVLDDAEKPSCNPRLSEGSIHSGEADQAEVLLESNNEIMEGEMSGVVESDGEVGATERVDASSPFYDVDQTDDHGSYTPHKFVQEASRKNDSCPSNDRGLEADYASIRDSTVSELSPQSEGQDEKQDDKGTLSRAETPTQHEAAIGLYATSVQGITSPRHLPLHEERHTCEQRLSEISRILDKAKENPVERTQDEELASPSGECSECRRSTATSIEETWEEGRQSARFPYIKHVDEYEAAHPDLRADEKPNYAAAHRESSTVIGAEEQECDSASLGSDAQQRLEEPEKHEQETCPTDVDTNYQSAQVLSSQSVDPQIENDSQRPSNGDVSLPADDHINMSGEDIETPYKEEDREPCDIPIESDHLQPPQSPRRHDIECANCVIRHDRGVEEEKEGMARPFENDGEEYDDNNVSDSNVETKVIDGWDFPPADEPVPTRPAPSEYVPSQEELPIEVSANEEIPLSDPPAESMESVTTTAFGESALTDSQTKTRGSHSNYTSGQLAAQETQLKPEELETVHATDNITAEVASQEEVNEPITSQVSRASRSNDSHRDTKDFLDGGQQSPDLHSANVCDDTTCDATLRPSEASGGHLKRRLSAASTTSSPPLYEHRDESATGQVAGDGPTSPSFIPYRQTNEEYQSPDHEYTKDAAQSEEESVPSEHVVAMTEELQSPFKAGAAVQAPIDQPYLRPTSTEISHDLVDPLKPRISGMNRKREDDQQDHNRHHLRSAEGTYSDLESEKNFLPRKDVEENVAMPQAQLTASVKRRRLRDDSPQLVNDAVEDQSGESEVWHAECGVVSSSASPSPSPQARLSGFAHPPGLLTAQLLAAQELLAHHQKLGPIFFDSQDLGYRSASAFAPGEAFRQSIDRLTRSAGHSPRSNGEAEAGSGLPAGCEQDIPELGDSYYVEQDVEVPSWQQDHKYLGLNSETQTATISASDYERRAVGGVLDSQITTNTVTESVVEGETTQARPKMTRARKRREQRKRRKQRLLAAAAAAGVQPSEYSMEHTATSSRVPTSEANSITFNVDGRPFGLLTGYMHRSGAVIVANFDSSTQTAPAMTRCFGTSPSSEEARDVLKADKVFKKLSQLCEEERRLMNIEDGYLPTPAVPTPVPVSYVENTVEQLLKHALNGADDESSKGGDQSIRL